jgi:hypothetical protein
MEVNFMRKINVLLCISVACFVVLSGCSRFV